MRICHRDSRFAQTYPFCAKKRLDVTATVAKSNPQQPIRTTKVQGEGSDMRTPDLDEAIDAVTRVCCPHTVEITGPARKVDVVLVRA
jgi:hypothetical protein